MQDVPDGMDRQFIGKLNNKENEKDNFINAFLAGRQQHLRLTNGDWNTVWMDISHLHPRHLVNIKFASMHTMQLETTAVLMFM